MTYIFNFLLLFLAYNVYAASDESLSVRSGQYQLSIQSNNKPALMGGPTLVDLVKTSHQHLLVTWSNGSGYYFTNIYTLKGGVLQFVMALSNRFSPVVQGNYLHGQDKSFMSWFNMFPGVWYGPEPKLVYAFQKGAYQLAPKKMKKKPLSPKVLKEKVAAILKSPDLKDRMVKVGDTKNFTLISSHPMYTHPLYWETIFDLAYSGNMPQASEVIRKVFSAEDSMAIDQHIQDFKNILQSSPNWSKIQIL